MTKADKIFEKHIGSNAEMGYLPIKKEDVIDAINDALNQTNIDIEHENIKDIVLAEYKKGNIVICTTEGLQIASLQEIIKQPIDGLLYDLNRNESVVLTFINDIKWINDYAMVQVIRELKNQLDNKL